MGYVTAENVAQRAFDLGLLDERQLQEAWASFGSRNVSIDEFVQLLVRREMLTNYQVERLVKGERSGFFFGDYKVLYLVGAGTFARVYRAVQRKGGQVVAVKVLRNRYSENPAQYGQFVREGRVGCTLRHPNIVPIYDVFSEARMHFLVMDFVEGWNLREFVKVRKHVEPLQAVKLMSDICRGMQYAFEHGLTHRDLKMNNVLVSSRGEAKLVDFGLAAIDDTLTEDTLVDLPNARTIDYAALERASRVRKDDTRSDIYFMGCILYHMLTGKPPLSETRDRLQRLSKSRFLEVTPIRKVDPNIHDLLALVVNKSMMLDANRRYQSPGAMLSDLEIGAQRLLAEAESRGGSLSAGGAAKKSRAVTVPPEEQLAVMVVESATEMQDVFRSSLKRAGYRVLLTADPSRAYNRLQQESGAADCIVLNAQQIGRPALEMFNRLGKDNKTSCLPALLLLDDDQRAWSEDAETADHRVVLTMPITMKQLRSKLAKLVTTAAGARNRG